MLQKLQPQLRLALLTADSPDTEGVRYMSNHTPLIRLAAARNSWQAAQSACPHWDYESDGTEHECCVDLYEAGRELSAARRMTRSAERLRGA